MFGKKKKEPVVKDFKEMPADGNVESLKDVEVTTIEEPAVAEESDATEEKKESKEINYDMTLKMKIKSQELLEQMTDGIIELEKKYGDDAVIDFELKKCKE